MVLLFCQLIIFTLQSNERLLSTYYASETYDQRNLTACKQVNNSNILNLSNKEVHMVFKCGQICGTFDQCSYFFYHIGRLCLMCMNDSYDDVYHLNKWQWKVLPDTKVWFNKKDQLYSIGYDKLVNKGKLDVAKQHSIVDLTPVPARSKLVTFTFNVRAVNREIRFGVYKRYENSCIFELVHQWITNSTHLGQNKYYTNDFIVEKGYHIGFTFTQYGVIPFTKDSIQRYCVSFVPLIVNEQKHFTKHHAGYRKYLFQGKFTIF